MRCCSLRPSAVPGTGPCEGFAVWLTLGLLGAGFFLFAVQPFKLGDKVAVTYATPLSVGAAQPSSWFEGTCEKLDLRCAPQQTRLKHNMLRVPRLPLCTKPDARLCRCVHACRYLQGIVGAVPSVQWVPNVGSNMQDCLPQLSGRLHRCVGRIPCRYTTLKSGPRRLYVPNSAFVTREFMVIDGARSAAPQPWREGTRSQQQRCTEPDTLLASAGAANVHARASARALRTDAAANRS